MQLKIIIRTIMILAVLHLPAALQAQYFGRNKPGYRSFEYKLNQSPDFELYHYLGNDSLLNEFLSWAEEWYGMHQLVFRDTFEKRNPLILYNTHADFQQTNAVSGLLGAGTGGVTEGLKNRVVMPVAKTLTQTDHVLGHELVHAFQFHKIATADTSKDYSVRNLPLWMIEGMAEYLSIGSVDPNTAMWIRDALVNNDFPTLEQLTKDPKYFPYRFGHSFWALVGKTWGDTIIMPLFEKTAQYGYRKAVDSVLNISSETLSELWESASRTHFGPYISGAARQAVGRKVIHGSNAGRVNVSPSVSPDGKYIAFFSDKDVFTFDIFLAEVSTGKILRKLTGTRKQNDFDDYNFIESAGTWSPSGDKFAFIVFEDGLNKLVVTDVRSGRVLDKIVPEPLRSFSNPAWSPDGEKIVFSGLSDGKCDLYVYKFDSGETERLTDDFTGNIHPSWSPDGETVIYAQEQLRAKSPGGRYGFALATINIGSGEKKIIDVFPGAKNLNPCFSPDGSSVYFVSDADGMRNLYRYDFDDRMVYRLTDYATGVSGITAIAPSISRNYSDSSIVYTYYYNNSYDIYLADDTAFSAVATAKDGLDMRAATLPPLNTRAPVIVDSSLYNRKTGYALPPDSIIDRKYKPRFTLDYISNSTGVGVSAGQYGSVMQGSVNMIFSDIVGNNQLYSSLALNGEIYDFGGLVSYLNQKGRIKWGASVSHIPYRNGYMSIAPDTITVDGDSIPVHNLRLDFIRMFEDNASVFAYYPISQTRRIEATASMSWYYFRRDRYNNYYSLTGLKLFESREKMPSPGGDNYQQLSLAYVEDNSYAGMTSPMKGHRARYQLTRHFGAVSMYTAIADYRKYFFVKPLALAFRLYHYGRYGQDAGEDIISPLYLGYPWLIRGYENVSLIGSSNRGVMSGSFNVSHLSGSRMLVGNIELRYPFTGIERLAPIKSRSFFTDLNLFFDAGLAWYKDSDVSLEWQPVSFDSRIPVYSAGLSARVNLVGALVLEPYLAVPFQNGGFDNIQFGFNITPGW
ncbi:MAG: hypothetical protein ACLFN1_08015 [Bacteroidales bacterium]